MTLTVMKTLVMETAMSPVKMRMMMMRMKIRKKRRKRMSHCL